MTPPIDYTRLVLPPTATLREAIARMTETGTDIVLVAGRDGRLLGILVDSDVRKALLRGRTLAVPAGTVMNRRPVTLPASTDRAALVRYFSVQRQSNIPLLGPGRRIAGLARREDYSAAAELPNWVVLLVGGRGRRLHPLTQDRPKPLLPVGEKPILETIVGQFVAGGFRNFVFALNHQASQIRGHFGDGSRFGARIRYVHERSPLGTAGALSLLPPEEVKHPFLVMNGDLLTKVDFQALLRFHESEKAAATLCVREYTFQVPFGVVRMNGHRMKDIVEKPEHKFFVNAGIYVLDPVVLRWVRPGKVCDMPTLLERVARRRPGKVNCFPVLEYWIDIGHLEDYRRAQSEFGKFFAP